MKKLFYLLVMFSSVLWSCSKGNGEVDEPTNPDDPNGVKEVYWEVDHSELVFEAYGGAEGILVQCIAFTHKGSVMEYDWTLTSGDEL